MSSESEIVQVCDVVKDFRPGFGIRKKRVLHGISFGVMPGEIFGFVGQTIAGIVSFTSLFMVWTGFTLAWHRLISPLLGRRNQRPARSTT